MLKDRGVLYPIGTKIMPWCVSCVRKVSAVVSWPPPCVAVLTKMPAGLPTSAPVCHSPPNNV
eukprot:21066-Heterococcus_DN1.PRE.1